MAVLATIASCTGSLSTEANRPQYVVAFSSVSHMGIVGLGLSTVTAEGLSGAIFQMFAHGIMTALLFSSLGYIYDKTHSKLIPDLGGMSRSCPWLGLLHRGGTRGNGGARIRQFLAEVTVFISALKSTPSWRAGHLRPGPERPLHAASGAATFYGQKNERYAQYS